MLLFNKRVEEGRYNESFVMEIRPHFTIRSSLLHEPSVRNSLLSYYREKNKNKTPIYALTRRTTNKRKRFEAKKGDRSTIREKR